MAKLNENYEAMIVFSLTQGEDAMKALVEKFKSRIERHATLNEVDESWGKRKLAYPINDELEGYYVIYSFSSTPDFPAEFERRLNISDGILRSLITIK